LSRIIPSWRSEWEPHFPKGDTFLLLFVVALGYQASNAPRNIFPDLDFLNQQGKMALANISAMTKVRNTSRWQSTYLMVGNILEVV
jgi:hypothetical protein